MTNRNVLGIGAAVASCLLLAVGCSGGKTVTGQPTPASNVPSSTSSGLPSDGAPAVPKPLKTSAIENSPCGAITADQVASLGSPEKGTEPHSDPSGPGCSWQFTTEHPSSFTGSTLAGSGVSGAYANRQSVNKFQPFTADGYPGAVYTDSTLPGECAANIGLRDDFSYVITVSLDTRSVFADPCELGKKVAGFIVEYLKKEQN